MAVTRNASDHTTDGHAPSDVRGNRRGSLGPLVAALCVACGARTPLTDAVPTMGPEHSCATGSLCDGYCVDETTDPDNCGGCGVQCQGGTCLGGACSCNDGPSNCDGTLIGDRCLTILVPGDVALAMSVAIDNANVYWLSPSGAPDSAGSVGRVSKCGGTSDIISSAEYVDADVAGCLASQGPDLFWAGGTWDGAGIIGEVPSTGSAPPSRPVKNGSLSPSAFAVDEDSIYWTTEGPPSRLTRTSRTAGSSTLIYEAGSELIPGVALSQDSVFWTGGPGGVYAAPKAGGSPATLWYSRFNFAGYLAVNDSNAFWVVGDRSGEGILTMPLTGGLVTTLVAGEAVGALTADSEFVYWAHPPPDLAPLGGSIRKVSVLGGTVTTIVSGPEAGLEYFDGWCNKAGTNIAVDAYSIYWATASGEVAKVTPK
jgi:hypothetical protein